MLETDLDAVNCLNFLEKLGNNNIGIVFDLGNVSQLNYDLYNDISVLYHLIGEIHLKDKSPSHSLRLGNGDTNFEDAFKALK